MSRAPDARALLAQAIHNTDSVRTLVHNDRSTTITKGGTVTITARGEEDEAQNRERDYESVTVRAVRQTGKAQTIHYTVDIIFMNGQTYYRSSLQQNKWKVQSGMVFSDPFTGGWQRGRTTVQVPTGAKFTQVGGTSSAPARMHTSFKTSSYRGIEDLWISGGKTPYVVREDLKYHSTGANQVTYQTQVSLGPFNQSMNIQAPTIGA